MQDTLIDLILKINKKYFFKKEHPFNISKNGVLNINYSDFEYEHTKGLVEMYEKIPLPPFLKGDLKEIEIGSSSPLKKGIIGDFFSNKRILEIGCGGGGKSVYIAEKYNAKVVGLDINDNFLSQARDFAKEKGVEDITEFVNRSALDTDFEDDSFDIIIMSDVIEHIPETAKLFDEMWRILKKDGVILFDFAPYYHYFGHHLWDTIQIPWIHLIFTDKFLIKLYKKSVENLPDKKERIGLRIGTRPVSLNKYLDNETGNNPLTPLSVGNNTSSPDKGNGGVLEVFDYLNKIKRKNFEKIINKFLIEKNIIDYNIKYYMIKNLNIFSKVPFLREIFIRHIVGYIKK